MTEKPMFYVLFCTDFGGGGSEFIACKVQEPRLTSR